MNDLVPILMDASPATLTTGELRAFEKALGEAVTVLSWDGYYRGMSQRVLIENLVFLSDDRLRALCRVLSVGRERAEGGQIMREMALLLGAFPASTAPDPKIYSEMMIDEITACSPSILALKRACSLLRRTLNWPPSIAEVMEALRHEETKLWEECRIVNPDAVARTTKLIEAKLEELGKEREAKVARLEAELRSTLKAEAEGYPVHPPSVGLRREIERLKREETRAAEGH